MAGGITVDAWLAELAKLTKHNAEGWTTKEMAAQCGHSEAWVRRMVGVTMASGKVECVGWRSITRIDGGTGKSPVYRVVVAAKGKKR